MVSEPESLFVEEPLNIRIQRHNFDRLLMLSDGVFAIAITLLALELKLPAAWDGSVGQLLAATGRPLIGYLFGFGLVGAFWFMHRRLFAELARVDQVVTGLNLVLLGLVGLTPYVARMIAEAGPGRGIPFYLATIAGVLGSIALIRLWGSMRPKLLHEGVDGANWRTDGLFLVAGAIGLGTTGGWAMAQHRPVNQNIVLVTVVAILAGKQAVRRRRKAYKSSTSRP